MKLEQLEQVIEIAKTHSISKAATNLLLSQPGLSLSMKQLEGELGADLFIRTKKGVELTDVGSSFVEQAKRILEQINSLEMLGKGNMPHITQTLSVANGRYRFAVLVMAMMINKHKDDGSRFVLREGINGDCIDWVADGICDLGLIGYKRSEEQEFKQLMKMKQLQHHIICQPTTKVVIGAGHPLYNAPISEISEEEMEKYPLILYDETAGGNYYRSVYYSHVNSDRKNLRAIVTDRSAWYDLLEFTEAYALGASNDIVYRNIPRQSRTRSLTLKNSKKESCIAIIHSHNVESLPLAKEYIELITDVYTKPDFWALHPDLTINPSKQP